MVDRIDTSRSEITAPKSRSTGCWAAGALVPDFKLAIDAHGCRRLVPAGPAANEVRETILALLAASAWQIVEAVVADILETLAPPDGSLEEVPVERFNSVWLNVLEAEPRSPEERGLVVLREKIKMLTTLHFGKRLHSDYVPEINGSQNAIERLSRIYLEIAESLRQQKVSSAIAKAAKAPDGDPRIVAAAKALKKKRQTSTAAAGSGETPPGDTPQVSAVGRGQPTVPPSSIQLFQEAAE